MIRAASGIRPRARLTLREYRRVGICRLDPGAFVLQASRLPGGLRGNIPFTWESSEAIEAAMAGRLDVLVVDANRTSFEGMTALNFLRHERPEVSIYLYSGGEDGSSSRLVLWE